jgi:hypothetical protein
MMLTRKSLEISSCCNFYFLDMHHIFDRTKTMMSFFFFFFYDIYTYVFVVLIDDPYLYE